MNTVENQVTDTMYKDNETVVSELNDYFIGHLCFAPNNQAR